MTPLALLAGCPTGAVSPPSALEALWNPGMVEWHYLDSTLSLNLSRTRSALHSTMSRSSHSRTRQDAPGYVGW
ncbi:hypothetical protein BDV27DRAFT_139704 [Aspergillus caelatus]|uniref:Uncharacterized protein n=1 Tax=Aspergillus caelatus TaxID=61420 RepID=A0A5N6ZJV3_9EURO|nr:uncharacterized protein BDV27DRAFT_139704 [Aspergillus caelatus]KAE8357246.1 hypothetical protein BDV27DRAFT_139704 [Aspergillus caelatus]